MGHSSPLTGLLYLYVRVHIQLPCVPNRPCCFRNFWHSASFCVKYWAWSVQQQWRTKKFCSGAVQQIHLRTEDRPSALPLYFSKKDAIRVLCFFPPGRKLWWNVGFDPISSVSLNGLSYYKIIDKFLMRIWRFECVEKTNTPVLISL